LQVDRQTDCTMYTYACSVPITETAGYQRYSLMHFWFTQTNSVYCTKYSSHNCVL